MYEDFLGRVGDQVEDPDSTTDAADLYEAQSLRFSVDQQYYEAIDQGLVARRRLQILMDTDPGRPVEVTSPPAPTIDLGKEPLPRLFALAREQDPGLRTALAAVQVAEAAVRQAGSEQRPSLFLVAGLEWSHAANRTDQSNPFVYDPYNRFRLGAAVDLRWDLNFRRHGLRSQERRIERDLAQARANAVAGQVLLRVEEAYREVITSDRLVEAALASRLSARAWLHISIDHWELGIGSLSRVVRAYERFFQTQGHVIRNELRRNLALTNLAVALGSFDLYLRWMNDGNVAVP
jgi:outer membrane protein TolC